MIFAFLILAAVLVWFSYKSFRGGLRYLAFFRSEVAKPLPDWTPYATVICPCRGVDEGMEENLSAILRQDYPDYQVIFVVDDDADPAVEVISRVQAQRDSDDGVEPAHFTLDDMGSPPRLRGKRHLLIAQKATESAQKVENLRAAASLADDRARVLVFVDSDTRVSPTWLRYLVAPLEDTSVGAASGYRWFISERPSFASEMRSVWNASIASALGPNKKSNFCWGGSTAIRASTFNAVGMNDRWKGTLSDDFVVTRAMHDAGLGIVHVPQALTATIESCTFRELLEFTTRQMKITRVYMPHLWLMSFFGSAIFNLVMAWAFLIVVLSRENGWQVWTASATLVIVSAFSIGKSWLRLKAVRLALPQYDRELRRQAFTQNTLWLLSPLLFLYNSIAALVSRRMVWRGTTYELKSPKETVIIRG
jgi:cellulose synthase/poly-beta-1,6-N-acetylglucosamine synthase-like glycosyltransferase